MPRQPRCRSWRARQRLSCPRRLRVGRRAAPQVAPRGGHPATVTAVAVAVAVVIWVERQGPLSLLRQLGLALVLGGAIGNGLDRWRTGAVVDFVALVPIDFPIFNGADVAINLAVLCFAVDLLKGHGDRRG